MNLTFVVNKWSRVLLLVCASFVLCTTGCSFQSTVGGQTLPSAYYLRDDIQFFPAGAETRLPKLRRALAEYRLEQEAIRSGFAEDGL
jgi:hypothetical protein